MPSPPKNRTGAAPLEATPDALRIDASKVTADKEDSRQTCSAERPFILLNGKYRGQTLPEVSSDYLVWMASVIKKPRSRLRDTINIELNRRARGVANQAGALSSSQKQSARTGANGHAALSGAIHAAKDSGAQASSTRHPLMVAEFKDKPGTVCVFCPDCGFTAAGSP